MRWYLVVVLVCWAPFCVPVGHLYVVFRKMSLSLAHFLIRLLVIFCYWLVWIPYMFWILTSCQIHPLQIPYFVQCHFPFVDCFFAVWKLLLWHSPTCFIFLLVMSKKIASTYVKEIFPMFSYSSFMVSGLTFQFLFYFQLIFVSVLR